MADPAALRARLIELRRDALAQLAAALPIIDGGMLRLVADTSAVLAAIEAEATDNPETPNRMSA